MPQGNNELVQTYLKGLYTVTWSQDLTTNWLRRLKELTGDYTFRFKKVIKDAGSSN